MAISLNTSSIFWLAVVGPREVWLASGEEGSAPGFSTVEEELDDSSEREREGEGEGEGEEEGNLALAFPLPFMLVGFGLASLVTLGLDFAEVVGIVWMGMQGGYIV